MNAKILLGWWFVMSFAGVQAQSGSIDAPLTEAQVRQFIKTELAIGQLQKQIIAREGAYEQLEREEVNVFYKERAVLVARHGWTQEDFEDVRHRVFKAKASLQENEKYEKQQAEHQKRTKENRYSQQEAETQKMLRKMRSDLEQHAFLSAEQKKTMMDKIAQMQKQAKGMGAQLERGEQEYLSSRKADITENQADWPAVQLYFDQLQHLTDWYNGNRSDPPALD